MGSTAVNSKKIGEIIYEWKGKDKKQNPPFNIYNG